MTLLASEEAREGPPQPPSKRIENRITSIVRVRFPAVARPSAQLRWQRTLQSGSSALTCPKQSSNSARLSLEVGYPNQFNLGSGRDRRVWRSLSDSVDHHPPYGGVMAPRKRDALRLPIHQNQASAIPRPLLELYNRASLFLDKSSTHQDHYWAVGIHKAIHASFPDCGETHTATTQNPGRSCCQVSPHCHRNAGAVSENQAPIKQRKQPHNRDTSGQVKNEEIPKVSRA